MKSLFLREFYRCRFYGIEGAKHNNIDHSFRRQLMLVVNKLLDEVSIQYNIRDVADPVFSPVVSDQ